MSHNRVDPGEGRDGPGPVTGVVETNGIETYYERRGAGPAVVFIHGAVMDHGMWDAQMTALADGYTVVAYDVRGHGRTGGSDLASYSIETYVEDLDALLAALDLERPVLCGLLMGGCIAQTYAARHPEKVGGLVLADTFTPDLSTIGDRVQMGVLRAAVLPVRLIGYPRVQRALTWFQERTSRGARGDYAEIERLQAEMPPMSTAEFAKVVRSLTSFDEVTVDLGAITAPTLLLYGEHEPAFIRRQASLLETGIAGATLREVPDAGHASNVDNPAFFTGAVRAFLETAVDEA